MTMPKGGQSYNQIVAPPGMVGFWPGITVPVSGSVNDLSGNANNLLYTNGMTDTIRDGTAGYWSSSLNTAPNYNEFLVPLASFAPNVNGNNDSYFVSTVLNLSSIPSTLPIMGNAADLSYAGIVVYVQSSALNVYIKGSSQASLGSSATLSASTDYRFTLYIDGPTKKAFAWLNGTMFINNVDVSAYGTFYTAGNYWAFGSGGGPSLQYGGFSQAVHWKDATIFWLKANAYLKSPAYLDWLLRTKPSYQLTLLDTLR